MLAAALCVQHHVMDRLDGGRPTVNYMGIAVNGHMLLCAPGQLRSGWQSPNRQAGTVAVPKQC